MESINTLLVSVLQDPVQFYFIGFFVMLFVGEPLVLVISFLSATAGILSLPYILIIAYTSAIIGELFWFLVGRSRLLSRFKNIQGASTISVDIKKMIQMSHLDTPIRLLFATRLFTGLTVAAVLYLGSSGLSTARFIRSILLVNIFWTPLMVGIGYGAGKGYTVVATLYEGIHFSTEIGLLILVLCYVVYKCASRKKI